MTFIKRVKNKKRQKQIVWKKVIQKVEIHRFKAGIVEKCKQTTNSGSKACLQNNNLAVFVVVVVVAVSFSRFLLLYSCWNNLDKI